MKRCKLAFRSLVYFRALWFPNIIRNLNHFQQRYYGNIFILSCLYYMIHQRQENRKTCNNVGNIYLFLLIFIIHNIAQLQRLEALGDISKIIFSLFINNDIAEFAFQNCQKKIPEIYFTMLLPNPYTRIVRKNPRNIFIFFLFIMILLNLHTRIVRKNSVFLVWQRCVVVCSECNQKYARGHTDLLHEYFHFNRN